MLENLKNVFNKSAVEDPRPATINGSIAELESRIKFKNKSIGRLVSQASRNGADIYSDPEVKVLQAEVRDLTAKLDTLMLGQQGEIEHADEEAVAARKRADNENCQVIGKLGGRLAENTQRFDDTLSALVDLLAERNEILNALRSRIDPTRTSLRTYTEKMAHVVGRRLSPFAFGQFDFNALDMRDRLAAFLPPADELINARIKPTI